MKTNIRKPKISICIPNYNRADNLKELLLDCQNQTISPYEIIVQDDSLDESEIKKIGVIVKQFTGIRYQRNQKNLGLVKNVNKVIHKATGDYIAIVNNDDRLSKYYVQEIVSYTSKYKNMNIFTSNALAINDSGKVFADYRLFDYDKIIRKKEDIKLLWKNYFLNLISVSGATIYKRDYLQGHSFNEKYENESDLDNALSLLCRQDILYIDKPIYYVRLNQKNTSVAIRSDKKKLIQYVSRCLRIYESYKDDFDSVPSYLIKPKAVFFLQLFVKYHFNYKDVITLLKINSLLELVQVITNIPVYLFQHYMRVFTFRFRVKYFRTYYPTAYSD